MVHPIPAAGARRRSRTGLLVALAAIIALSVASPWSAHAGSSETPEIVDPAGDGNVVSQYKNGSTPPATVAGQDIVKVWLTNDHETFSVHVETAGPPMGFFQLMFDMPECTGYVSDPAPLLPAGVSERPKQGGFRINSFWWGPGRNTASNGQCAAEGQGRDLVTGRLTTVEGNVVTISVAFNDVLKPGAVLSNIHAYTYADVAGPAELEEYVIPG